ncbi:MAG: hypothetical protein ING25_10885 [Burkholderiales bacterium]|nr:hypothetical protein [Burkholderiales bacterium]
MANKQKAWRSAGKGRKAKINHVKLLPTPSFLFMGLMMRAGLYDPMPVTTTSMPAPAEVRQGKSWLSRALTQAKRWFK